MAWAILSKSSISSGKDNKGPYRVGMIDYGGRNFAIKSLVHATFVLLGMFSALLSVSWLIGGNDVSTRLIITIVAWMYISVTALVVRKRLFFCAATMLVGFYALTALVSMWQWGINIAFGILLLGITITLAGILIGAKYALAAGLTATVVVILLQILTVLKIHVADTSWQTGAPSLFGEVIGYCLLFITVSLVAWHFGKQTENSIVEATKLAAELSEQKSMLASRLKEQSKTLKALQKKEMQQLYKFAELGQLSTAMMHDLANHVAVLSLDLEGLNTPGTKQKIDNARTSISHIETLIRETRRQLREDERPKMFNPSSIVSNTVESIRMRNRSLSTEIRHNNISGDTAFIFGDPLRFTQVLSVLLMNAVDATKELSATQRKPIQVYQMTEKKNLLITVTDYGTGISRNLRRRIFNPFYGTKESGMGIGLFLAREIVRTHFNGTILLANAKDPTKFQLKIPLSKTTATNSPE